MYKKIIKIRARTIETLIQNIICKIDPNNKYTYIQAFVPLKQEFKKLNRTAMHQILKNQKKKICNLYFIIHFK